MDTNPARCPNCHAPIAPDAQFCGSCGSPCDRSHPAAQPVASAACGEKHPFTLEVSLPQAMCVDCFSPVIVEFQANSDVYESVEFVLRNGEAELVRKPCCEGRPGSASYCVSMNVKPRAAGRAMIELDVVCRCMDASKSSAQEEVVTATAHEEVFTATLDVEVNQPESAQPAPIIHVNPTISSDRAGDTKVGDININLGAPGAPSKSSDHSRDATCAGEFVPVNAKLWKSPSRLTLKGASGILQLVSDRVVTFGRNRANMIPLRICGSDGRVNNPAIQHTLSRYHFRIENTGCHCQIVDGQNGEPSSNGTRVDGEALRPCGCAKLRSGGTYSVAVGRTDVELKMDIGVFGDAYSRPAGFLIKRRDGSRERVCAVWREVPVDGGVVIWNGSRWTLRAFAADATETPLCLGTEITLGDAAYSVLPFHHLNLD